MVKTLFKLRVVTNKTHIARQAERLKRGEINRRRFIMSALATGVTLPTATALATRAEAAQPKAGGVLRMGIAHAETFAEHHAMATGNTLVKVASDGTLCGELAASIEPDKGAQRWVFDLRRNIGFSDGTDLDAKAVTACLSRTQTPGLHNQIASITADGSFRVVIDLHRPNPGFAWVLSDPALSIRASSGAGTGPYVVSAKASHLTKTADHWHPDQGHFEAIKLVALPDPVARLTALLNGEIDLMDDVDPGMFALLAHSPGICVIETEDAALYGFACENGVPADMADGIGRALGDDGQRRDLAQKVLLGHGRMHGKQARLSPDQIDGTIKLSPDADVFPGSREMVSFVGRMALRRGIPVETARSCVDETTPHFKTKRQRLRPTLDWTLSEILATRPDARLESLILHLRAAQSPDETAALREQAFAHLESQGTVFPLIANAIDAHASALTLPAGVYDPLRVTQRGWFA